MKKRFSVIETFHDFQLLDHITDRSASMGDGTSICLSEDGDEYLPVGTEGFCRAWEDFANRDIESYMEAYFPDLYALQIQCIEVGEFVDPYTVVLTPSREKFYHCLSLSENCDSPQGVGLFGECLPGPHLGTRVNFTDLPQNMQRYIAKRLED